MALTGIRIRVDQNRLKKTMERTVNRLYSTVLEVVDEATSKTLKEAVRRAPKEYGNLRKTAFRVVSGGGNPVTSGYGEKAKKTFIHARMPKGVGLFENPEERAGKILRSTRKGMVNLTGILGNPSRGRYGKALQRAYEKAIPAYMKDMSTWSKWAAKETAWVGKRQTTGMVRSVRGAVCFGAFYAGWQERGYTTGKTRKFTTAGTGPHFLKRAARDNARRQQLVRMITRLWKVRRNAWTEGIGYVPKIYTQMEGESQPVGKKEGKKGSRGPSDTIRQRRNSIRKARETGKLLKKADRRGEVVHDLARTTKERMAFAVRMAKQNEALIERIGKEKLVSIEELLRRPKGAASPDDLGGVTTLDLAKRLGISHGEATLLASAWQRKFPTTLEVLRGRNFNAIRYKE